MIEPSLERVLENSDGLDEDSVFVASGPFALILTCLRFTSALLLSESVFEIDADCCCDRSDCGPQALDGEEGETAGGVWPTSFSGSDSSFWGASGVTVRIVPSLKVSGYIFPCRSCDVVFLLDRRSTGGLPLYNS